MKNTFGILFTPVFLLGCATASPIPEGAEPLNDEEIVETFSDVKETYRGRDIPGMRATGIFNADGSFEASWAVSNRSGVVVGEWYAEDGRRCLKDEKPSGDTSLECIRLFKTGDTYTSVNEDGSIHGFHTLTSLEQAEQN